MHIPKNYFHDRAVLLLISLNIFLAALGSLLIFLRLDGGDANTYIVQYRSNLGLSAYKSGSATAFFAFVAFFIFIVVFHTVLSARTYNLRRHFSVIILAMASLLLILGIIVSNALLVLR